MATTNSEITQVSPSQSDKVTTINAAIEQLDNLLANELDVTVTADFLLTGTEQNNSFSYNLTGTPSDFVMAINARQKLFAVRNETGAVATIEVDPDEDGADGRTVDVADGNFVLLFSDGLNVDSIGTITSGGGGSSAFVTLTDTPSDYTGQAGKMVVVNGAEDALVFTDPPSGGSGSSGSVLYPGFSAPSASDYTLNKSSNASSLTATLTDETAPSCVQLYVEGGGTTDAHVNAILDEYTGSETAWRYTVGVVCSMPNVNFMTFGVFMHETATGRFYDMGFGPGGGAMIGTFNTFTSDGDSFDSGASGKTEFSLSNYGYNNGLIYLRLEYTGTFWNLSISTDGENFNIVANLQESSDEFTTGPDRIGVTIKPNFSGVSDSAVRATFRSAIKIFHHEFVDLT